MRSVTSFPAFCSLIGLNLEPFQRRIASAAGGPERELAVLLPRGNGKTTLLAAIALWHLVTVERAEVYAAAASREQARILYEAAARFARELGHPHLVDRHLELRWCPDPGKPRVFTRHLRVLAADAPRLMGLTPSLAIVDELGEHPNDHVYLALRTALPKRPGSKLIAISAAGMGTDTALGRLRARALAQPSVKRRGACTDARGASLRMLEWAVPEDVAPTARAAKRANPASWITTADLAAQREAVPELAWLRYHCGRWTARAGHWLPPGAWQQCVGEPELVAGERVWVGVDVGGGGSEGDTAVCWVNEQLHVGVAVFDGEDGVLQARDLIDELAERYSIAECVFDPWRASQIALELGARGMRTVTFPQTDERMIPASARLHRAVVEQRLVLPADEVLAQHAATAVARHGRRGWRLDRPSRAAGDNIDAIVALAMAVDRASARSAGLEVVGYW
jgi:phage terminase large subunit-like protein